MYALFAVAICGDSASGTSFHILNGIPVFIDQEYSDGAFPIAVTEHNGTVYLLNAGGSGAVVAFKADSLGGLHELQNSSTFLTSLNSDASSISVIPNGQWLIVIEKATNSIDVFPVHPDGTLGTVVNNKRVTPGVFATVFTPNGQLIVSENQHRTAGPGRQHCCLCITLPTGRLQEIPGSRVHLEQLICN